MPRTTVEMTDEVLILLDAHYAELIDRMGGNSRATKAFAADLRQCMELLETRHRLERIKLKRN